MNMVYSSLKGAITLTLLCVFAGVWPADAQSAPTIHTLCPSPPTAQNRPNPGLDTLYEVSYPSDSTQGYVLKRTSQMGTELLPIPIPAAWFGGFLVSKVSPDGRYLLFTPYYESIPLIVWKIGTPELATLLLNDEDFTSLAFDTEPNNRQDDKISWIDQQTFEIRYLDADVTTTGVPIATKRFTISDQPFAIAGGQKVEVSNPNISFPTTDESRSILYSPQGHYVTFSSRQVVRGELRNLTFRVFDTTTLALKIDLPAAAHRGPIGHPVWRPNEDRFFVVSYEPTIVNPTRRTLTEVFTGQNFQPNTVLQQTLESHFGPDMILDLSIWPVISPSGNLLMFSLTDSDPQPSRQYLVVQDLNTSAITAICITNRPDFNLDRLVWSPDERYVGTTSGYFDRITSVAYSDIDPFFPGWLPVFHSATPTPTATLTPTSTPTNTPTPTPTFTPSPTPGTPPQANGRGLRAAYFDNGDFTGLKFYRLDGRVNFTWNTAAPNAALAADSFSLRWVGEIEAPATGSYTFQLRHDNIARLWINGQQVITGTQSDTAVGTSSSQPISLVGGMKMPIQVEYVENAGLASVILEWIRPGQTAAEVVPASALYAPS
jgi:hypothetical protein